MNFHTLGAALTFILLPPFWFLSVPALLYSYDAKKFSSLGATILARTFAEKSLRFTKAAWLIFAILAGAALSLFALASSGLV